MKILKIFGIVVGIHVFALLLIFANPGCSSSSKQPGLTDGSSESPATPASATSTTVTPAPAPVVNPTSSSAISFNPDAPAVSGPLYPSASSPMRQSPTRPGTPVAQAIVDEPVADVAPAETYVVKNGDNLWNIAKKYHLDYRQLASANNLPTGTVLHAGQKLVIPGKPAAATAPKGKAGLGAAKTAPATAAAGAAPGMDAPAAAAPKGEGMKHIVQSGESISVIARRYGVKTGDLALANGITDPKKI
ncbi:MAG TPA: LysM peptidoglycan-binding domain-containing protein, partial [Opitutaceae bacterium]